MSKKDDSLFKPACLEDFLPKFLKDKTGPLRFHCRRQTYRIVEKVEVRVSASQKKRSYWIIQYWVNPSVMFIVEVPENLNRGDSITFMERLSKADARIRINLDKSRKGKGVRIGIYTDPKSGAKLRYNKSLLYQKIKNEWILVEVDGRII